MSGLINFAFLVFAFSGAQSGWQSVCNHTFDDARALFKRGQYLLSSHSFRQIGSYPCQNSLQREADFFLMKAMYLLDEPHEARLIAAKNIKSDSPKPFQYFAAAHLDLELGEFSKDLQSRVDLWRFRYNLEKASQMSLDSKLQDRKLNALLRELNSPPGLSPWQASSLSVVPGFGQAVMGAYSSAALSVVINGLFAWATYAFVDKELYGPAAASSMILSITYFGNIIQAGRLAKQKRQAYQTPLETEIDSILSPDF